MKGPLIYNQHRSKQLNKISPQQMQKITTINHSKLHTFAISSEQFQIFNHYNSLRDRSLKITLKSIKIKKSPSINQHFTIYSDLSKNDHSLIGH